MSIDSFRIATLSDAEAIAELINSAYRPTPESAGWTHEADLIDGNRVSATQVIDEIIKNDSAVFISLKDSEIVACIHVEKEDDGCHLGMFAVTPELQGAGVGKQMLTHAEKYARTTFAAKKFVMFVISIRRDLIAFYARHGYYPTGAIMEYPLWANVGIPKRDGLQVIVLEKEAGND